MAKRKAIMVEEGTTNLNSDPFFKTGVSGWRVGTWTTLEWLSSEYNPFSKQNGVMRLYDNDGGTGFCSKIVSISNTPHTVSVLLKILKGNINSINVGGTIFYTDRTSTDYTWNNSNTTRYDMSAIFGQGVYKLVATITPNSSKTISSYQIRISHNDRVETELLVYAVQLEAKPYATSFIDGTRAAETLTIPTAGVLNPQEGTISVWVYVNDYLKTDQGTTRQMFWWSGTTGRISLGWLNTRKAWYAVTRNGTNNSSVVTIPDTLSVGWHLFTMRWSATELALLIDGGAQKATAANPYLPTSVSGPAYIGSGLHIALLNSLIDDLHISNRARTDEEIAQAYASGQKND